jgi:hypothetical protein
MTCLVVSALLFSPFAWKVGAGIVAMIFAVVFAVLGFAVSAVASEADRQAELEYREAFPHDVAVEPVALAQMASDLNMEVN